MDDIMKLLVGALTVAVGLLLYDRFFRSLRSPAPTTTVTQPRTIEQILAEEGF